MNIKLSAVIITYNEEQNIERCLDSLHEVADEIVVVDSFSADRTEAICRSREVIFLQHPFEGYLEQQHYALQQTLFPHVLSLDADEALSDELKQSIQYIKQHWQADGYQFNRLTNYCGQWIRHCGWYPDTKLRVWDKRCGTWAGENPHYYVKMKVHTQVRWISGDLLHYSFYTIRDHADTANRFSEIAAREAFKKKRKINIVVHVLLNPAFTFIKKYMIQQGFREGYYGLVICMLSAYANFLKYSKIYALQLKKADEIQKNSVKSYG